MTAHSASLYSALQVQCQDYLRRALSGLGVSMASIYRLNLTPLILPPMVGVRRFFHNFEHLVTVGGQSDSIEMLAGAFHDLVYVHVDTGIPFNLTCFLNRVIRELDGELILRSGLPANPELHWLLKLFGLQSGQTLSPLQGQNEFLSALVAIQALAPVLSAEHRLAIATCIEATIPFRVNKGSQGLPEVMLMRLRSIVQEHGLALNEAQLVEIVRRSVRVANRDVASFAQPTAVGFLADTWNLLPENNQQFSPQGLYRVEDYRRSIEATESFFRKVSPNSIFRQFRGVPPTEVYQQWQEQASQNLAVGRLYLSCKLVTIALLEALSEPLGQQTTIAMMMGNLPSSKNNSANGAEGGSSDGKLGLPCDDATLRLEAFLPPVHWTEGSLSIVEKEVWQLLTEGRAESNHQGDLLNSPLAAFIVQCHRFSGIPPLRRRAKAWLEGSLTTTEFLSHFDPQFMAVLLEAIQRLWDQRQQMFRHYFWLQSETPTQFVGGGLVNRSATQRR